MSDKNTDVLLVPQGFMPSSLLPPRVPQNGKMPAYALPNWDHKLRGVGLAYAPSGRVDISTLWIPLVLPSVLVPLAFTVAHLPLRLFGWGSMYFDFILVGVAAIASFSLGSKCRNRLVAGVVGLLAAVLLWFVSSWLGLFDQAYGLSFRGTSTSLGEQTKVLTGFTCALLPVAGWWAAGSNPYCETCNKNFTSESVVTTLNKVWPAAVFGMLRVGRIPKASADFATPGASTVMLKHSACPECGVGILSAYLKQFNSEHRFYSEMWSKRELAAGHRDDAPASATHESTAV